MWAVCVIRVERRNDDALLWSVLTTHDLAGGQVEHVRATEAAAVWPLVQTFVAGVADPPLD